MEDRGWSQNNPRLETDGFCWRAQEVDFLIRHSGAGRNPFISLLLGSTDESWMPGLRRHDEPSLRLKHVLSIVEVASNLSHPQRDFNEEGLWN